MFGLEKRLKEAESALSNLSRTRREEDIDARFEALNGQAQEKATEADFWEQFGHTKSRLEQYNALQEDLEHALGFGALVHEQGTEEDAASAITELEQRTDKANYFALESLLTEPHDKSDAIIRITYGRKAFGLGAEFVEHLANAYIAFVERNDMDIADVDIGETEARIHIAGEFAYGFLRGEHGVHRVEYIGIRNKPRTAYLSVEIQPAVDTVNKLEENDVEEEAITGSGPGGQHVNKKHTSVRLTHTPTGVQAVSRGRSREQNRKLAMQALQTKVSEALAEEPLGMKYVRPEAGRHFRNYDYRSEPRIADINTGVEITNGKISEFERGDLFPFIFAYHFQEALRKKHGV